MFSRLAVTLFLLLPSWLQAQTRDSLQTSILPVDPIKANVQDKLDSIQLSSTREYALLKLSYDSISTSANNRLHQLQGKIDSLQNLNLNTSKLTSSLDSVTKWTDERIRSITSKVEKLKSTVNEKINELNLPPELREKANEFTSMMNKLDVTLPNANLQESLLQQLSLKLPNLNETIKVPDISAMDIASNAVPDLELPSVNTGNIGGQVQQYQSQVAQLPTNLESAAKLAEEQATKIAEVTNIQGELGRIDELTKNAAMLQDQEKLKEQLVKEVKEQAIDHFAGKKVQLDKAMQSISKYKQKFPTITSLNDLPKKAPNEMKSKPFIERIVPGLAFQLQKKNDDLFIDFNPYFAYRFTKRFSSGAGWNQRVGYNTHKHSWSQSESRVYGPRIFSEYKIGKGFSPRLEIETMNTFVPPYVKVNPTDPGQREWVWGAFAGIKKDYTLFKKIKGTALVMLRLFDPQRKSPYADVVNARFGWEFPLKKKHP